MVCMTKPQGFRGKDRKLLCLPALSNLKRNTTGLCEKACLGISFRDMPFFTGAIMKSTNANFTIREICIMSFMAVSGIFTKPLVSPVFNLMTDFVRIPGGSVSAGFSMLFLVFTAALIGKKGTATLMAFLQAVIAFTMGLSSAAGILVFITYTLPGVAVDCVMCCGLLSKTSLKNRMMLSGIAGVLTGAVMSNVMYFHLTFVAFMLFYSLGIISGGLGGYIAYIIMNKIPSGIRTLN